MKFSWSTDRFVLVQQWTTSTTPELVAALCVSCALAVCHEAVRYYLASLADSASDFKRRHPTMFVACQTPLYMLSMISANILMLFLMTYNTGILISMLIGAGIGFFIFRPLFIKHKIIINPKSTTKYTKKNDFGKRSVEHSALLAKDEGESRNIPQELVCVQKNGSHEDGTNEKLLTSLCSKEDDAMEDFVPSEKLDTRHLTSVL